MTVLYILLAVLALIIALLLVALVRAIIIKDRTPMADAPTVDMAKAKQYGEKLSQLIQVETVNDKGMSKEETAPKFANFRQVVSQLYPTITEKLELKLFGDAMLYKWKGKDSSKGSVVLLAHSDVVPSPGDWSYPPYGGVIENDKVWGRGAMDNKGAFCCLFQSVEELLLDGFTPPVDVYLVSSNNEETMGDGALQIANYLTKQGIKIDLVVDEGGAVVEEPIGGVKGKYCMVGVLEKGYGDIKFTARSKGGHSSMPPKNTPIARLSAFVNEVETKPPFKRKITPALKEMFENLAPHMPFGLRLLFGNLWLFGPLLTAVIPSISTAAGAMLQTSCVFTMAEGSQAPNVIPNQASVVANVRYMSHQPRKETLAIFKQLADKYDLEMEEIVSFDVSPTVDSSTEMFQFVYNHIQSIFPDAGISTYVMTGGTDAKYFANICPCTVRFSPLVLSPSQLAAMHAVDENVDLSALARGVDFYKNLLLKY